MSWKILYKQNEILFNLYYYKIHIIIIIIIIIVNNILCHSTLEEISWRATAERSSPRMDRRAIQSNKITV